MLPRGCRSLVSRLRSSVRAFLLSDEPPESLWKWPGDGRPSLSDVTVTDQTTLRVTAVLSCVKILAESISTLPLMVFEREENGDKRPAVDHPLTSILHTLANGERTAQSVRETLCAHVLMRGNAYARVVRDDGGEVREVWTIAPGTIQPDRPRPGGPLVFHISETGAPPETLRTDRRWGGLRVRRASGWEDAARADLPPEVLDCLRADLTAPKYDQRSDGRIALESKDRIRDRTGRSPDHGDALALALVPRAMRPFPYGKLYAKDPVTGERRPPPRVVPGGTRPGVRPDASDPRGAR